MMSTVKRDLLVVFGLVSGVGCDRVTKAVAPSVLPESGAWSFLGVGAAAACPQSRGVSQHGGVAAGGVAAAIFLVGAGGALLALLGYVLCSRSLSPSSRLGLSLVLAGGVGNLVDRIRYDGAVVDFLNVGIGALRTGIFNVADLAIFAGALVLIAGRLGERARWM